MESEAMRSVFRYPGGKTKRSIQEWILAHRPAGIREYREPFVGGGGVFFGLTEAYERVWLNDKHEGLVAVYLALRDRADEFIRMCREIAPPREGDPMTDAGARGGQPKNKRLSDVFDSLKLNPDCDQALRYYFVNRTVHGSGRVNYDIPSRLYFSNPDGWNIVETPALSDASKLLQGVRVTCGDYRALFEAPGENVWIYADPPYVVNTGLQKSSQLYQHGFTMEDHHEFATIVRACRHKVCVSYDSDQDGLVRKLFSGPAFHIVEGSWKYAGTTNEKKEQGRELLIMNYQPPMAGTVLPPAQSNAPLTLAEMNELTTHELAIQEAIASGRESFVTIGRELAAIRDSGKPSQRLYRQTHETFEEYCQDRWGFTRQTVNRQIAAAKMYSVLEPMGSILPSTERQVREFARLESSEKAAEVWKRIVEQAEDPAKITASTIRKAVNEAIGYEPPAKDYVEAARRALARLSADERHALFVELFSTEAAA